MIAAWLILVILGIICGAYETPYMNNMNLCDFVQCGEGRHCELHQPPCNQPPCPQFARCIDLKDTSCEENPCAKTVCGPDTKCIIQERDCPKFPCCPIASCLPESELNEPPCINPCVDTICPFGWKCEIVQNKCFTPPCCPAAQCFAITGNTVPNQVAEEDVFYSPPSQFQKPIDFNQMVPPPIVKAGTCPAPIPGQVDQCTMKCNSDAECPSDQKCCSTSCGMTCLSPTYGVFPTPVKPGYCPQTSQPGPWTTTCGEDIDCPGSQKCCEFGNIRQCQDAVSSLINNAIR